MNFLAHLYLSGESDKVMVGNFITDFLTGPEARTYEKEIYKGILLHRAIDTFTDHHCLIAKSKKRLWQRHRHYSSVIVDIFYDHFLARNWNEYSDMPLEEFACKSYAVIQHYEDILPGKAKPTVARMTTGNWLVNYRNLTGIDRAMQGMARRASFTSKMAVAIEDLEGEYDHFEHDFRSFFPQLSRHAKESLDMLNVQETNRLGR